MNRNLILVAVLGLASCAPSPLYVQTSRGGTVGEIPRDGRGEPIWGAITSPPPPPPAPYVPPAPGIPVTGPGAERFAVVPPPPAETVAPTYTPPPRDEKQHRRDCRHWRRC